MTNFATYIDSTNTGADRAAGQGQAETHRSAAGRAGAGRHPRRRGAAAVAHLSRQQARRDPVPHHAGRTGRPPPGPGRPVSSRMTVVFDAGQNSSTTSPCSMTAGSASSARSRPRTAPTCSPRPARPPRRPRPLPRPDRRHPRTVSEATPRRAHPLTDPPRKQSRGLDQTLAKAAAGWPNSAHLARGKTRRDRAAVEAEIATIVKTRWVRILTWTLTGDTPPSTG